MRLWLQVRRLKIQRIQSSCQISKTRPQTNLVVQERRESGATRRRIIPLSQAARKKAKVDVECHLFVCETTQLTDFVNTINETSCCSTPDCNGMYRSADYFLSVFSMQVFVCFALVILCSVLTCMFRLFLINFWCEIV